ncbi:porin [Comamonas composti]|uniref:porin n=1 Tax=Comamonas composti TaxID=408558 RepID=UPI00146F95D9|nr:porin [Comamonas composti]
MNKKLCMAMLMATGMGGALAQSSVSIYGLIDMGLAQRYQSDALLLDSSYNATSVFGFRGSEDLGGGLRLNFQLEGGGFAPDTGAWTKGFDRQSWIGLSGGFGTVMMGRTTTPQNRIMSEYDLNNTAPASSPLKLLGMAANAALVDARQSNQIQYASPKLGGFTARVAYAMSEVSDGSKKNFLQLAANYKSGGLSLGAAFQPRALAGQLTANNANHQGGYMLGAKYDFGPLEASAMYTRNEKKTEGNGVGLGIAAPFGAWKLGAQYARITKMDNGAQGKGAAAFELFAKYTLSKRTYLYGTVGGANEKARQFSKLSEKNTFALGLVHRF